MRRLLVLIALLSFASAGSAQLQAPLQGPLIAVTPAQQDHIRLHDLGSGETRTRCTWRWP